jgi:hypothetical protein
MSGKLRRATTPWMRRGCAGDGDDGADGCDGANDANGDDGALNARTPPI